jgi:hypothetical protein
LVLPIAIASLVVGAAGLGLGVATSAASAKHQEAAIRAGKRSAYMAATVQKQQLANQASVEGEKQQKEAEILYGKIRVAAGESGIGTGGTYEAFMHQADVDLAYNNTILNRNLGMQYRRADSGLSADLAQLEGQRPTNWMLQGIGSGLSLMQSSLAIGSNLQTISTYNSTPTQPANLSPSTVPVIPLATLQARGVQ